MLIGLLADQSPGDHGIWLPFMGIECRCSTSAAIFALRYNCPILPIFCYRKAPGRWEIIFDDEIPNKLNGELRSVRDITIDINKAYEVVIKKILFLKQFDPLKALKLIQHLFSLILPERLWKHISAKFLFEQEYTPNGENFF